MNAYYLGRERNTVNFWYDLRQPISIFLSTTTKQIHKSSKFCFKHSSGYTSCLVIYIYSYSSTFEKSVFDLFEREKPVSLSNKYVLIGSFLGCLKIIYSMTFCSWTLKNETAFFNSSSYPTLWYKLLCDIIKINLCFVMIWFISWYPDSMIIKSILLHFYSYIKGGHGITEDFHILLHKVR